MDRDNDTKKNWGFKGKILSFLVVQHVCLEPDEPGDFDNRDRVCSTVWRLRP